MSVSIAGNTINPTCPGCCETGTGTPSEVENCCCPTGTGTGPPVNLPNSLIAEITGCDGGTYVITDVAPSVDGGVWNSGEGQICPELGTISTLLTFRCDATGGPTDCEFFLYMYDVAFGPFSGTLASCVPFLWVSDPIDLTVEGCTCGTFTVTVYE